ncbi:MAG TPA: hypothetical protein VGO45_12595 [Bacteroidia bacterium]|jgi:hypothetical protein|nr:hypothetical protein [Bacteroidia bacterium]
MIPLQTINQTSFFEGNGPTLIVITLFVMLALLACALLLLLKNLFFKHLPMAFGPALLFAMLGGLLGIFLHVYAIIYLDASRDTKMTSLFSTWGLFSLFTFAHMLAVPLLVLAFRGKTRKIKMLEEELKKKG